MPEIRVFGPPGTGKTTYLSHEIGRLTQKSPNTRVLVTSLTRTAAHEIASRQLDPDRCTVGTLHSHAYRSLGSPKLAVTPDAISEWNKTYPLFMLTGQSPSIDEPGDHRTDRSNGDDLMAKYDIYRARLTPRERWIWPNIRFFVDKWEDFKHANDLLDFTDLIDTAYTDVSYAPSRPTHIFADEAQDYSKNEVRLLRKWSSGMLGVDALILAGDPDQALYEWRGADPQIFMTPEIPEEFIRVLTQSYRVPEAVHEVARRIISCVRERRKIEWSPSRARTRGICSVEIANAVKDPAVLWRLVESDLSRDKSVMVLASCEYMLRPLVGFLKDEGVPFHNPYRKSAAAWNPLGSTHRGVSAADRVRAYLSLFDGLSDAHRGQEWLFADVGMWLPLVKGVLARGADKRISDEPQDSVCSMDALEGYMRDPDDAVLATGEAMAGLTNWVRQHMSARGSTARYALDVADRSGVNALYETPMLTIGTIHSVKGGEADSVYVIPDMSPSMQSSWWEHGGSDSINRQFYVACTRSREKLTLLQHYGGSPRRLSKFEWPMI